jgi:hypothetical protein
MNEGFGGVAYEYEGDLVQLTRQSLDVYMPGDGLSGLGDGGEGLGWGPSTVQTVPPTPGHSTRDAILQLINRGLDVFASTRTGNVYTKDRQQGSGLLLDENGNLTLSPTMLMVGAVVVFALFRRPPGSGGRGRS